jgi:hypothetical protein
VVDALSREAGTAAAWQNRNVTMCSYPQYMLDILCIAREDHTQRLHLVDRGVGSVDTSRGTVGTYGCVTAAEALGELVGE